MRINDIKSLKINEFLFALYYFSFSLLKPITTNIQKHSTFVLLFFSIFIFIIWMYKNRNIALNSVLCIQSCFLLILILIFLFNFLLYKNSLIILAIYNFVIYGLLPILFISNIKSYYHLMKYWSYISCFIGFLFLIDPLIEYRWSGGYMTFGFEVMLPAFAGTLILSLIYNKKYCFLLSLVFLLELIIFANKGAIITAIVFFIYAIMFFSTTLHNNLKNVIILLLLLLLYLYRIEIIDLLIYISDILNFDSYSLTTFRIMLGEKSDMVYDSRIIVYEKALNEIKNNIFFGLGIKGFEYEYGFYPHNFFLDLTLSFGILGVIVFLIVLIISFYRINNFIEKEKKQFVVLLFIFWFIPLQMSLSFWGVISFWSYWGIILSTVKKRQPLQKKLIYKK